MDHQPFKTWIVLDAPLDRSRKEQLEAHLGACPHCQQLQETQQNITGFFQRSPTPEPAPGFTQRWRERMEEKERRERRRLTWIILSGILLSLFSVLTAVGFQLRAQLPSFSDIILITVHQTARWIYYFNHLWDLTTPILRVGLRIIPRTWLISVMLALSGLMLIPLLQIMKVILSSKEAQS